MTGEQLTKECRILSIDAWREPYGWNWNNWFDTGETFPRINLDDSNRKILARLRNIGILSDQSKGIASIDDDGYNIVICQRSNGKPVFAIEYGNTI